MLLHRILTCFIFLISIHNTPYLNAFPSETERSVTKILTHKYTCFSIVALYLSVKVYKRMTKRSHKKIN